MAFGSRERRSLACGSCAHTSAPFPTRRASGRLVDVVGEELICGVVGGDERAAAGGRAGGRRTRVSGLFRAAVTLGLRACARGADAFRRAVGPAATRSLRAVRGDARDLPGVVGPASARWCGGDRRGAAPGRARGRASHDRPAAWPPAGDGPGVWLRAGRRRVELLRCVGVRWACALDGEQGAILPAGSALGDAVEALATAARAWALRFGPGGSPWETTVCMTGGRLLHGAPRDPP